MTFADKIRDLRIKNGLSQTRLAETIGVPLRTYRSWEKDGRIPMDRDVYVRLSDALNCDVSYLMSDDAEYSNTSTLAKAAEESLSIKEILNRTKEIFVRGLISEDEQLMFINDLKEIFMDMKLHSANYPLIRKTSENIQSDDTQDNDIGQSDISRFIDANDNSPENP